MNVASQSSFLNDANNIATDLNNNNNSNNNDSKVAYYNRIIASNEQYQKLNAFSTNWTEIKTNKPINKLNKNDPTYGVPLNEKTLKRGIQAHNHIYSEIDELCQIIRMYGVKDNNTEQYTIEFRVLFSVYNKISNKLVGLLLRTRKYGFVEFPGEVLFQGRDDNVIIKLLHTVQK